MGSNQVGGAERCGGKITACLDPMVEHNCDNGIPKALLAALE